MGSNVYFDALCDLRCLKSTHTVALLSIFTINPNDNFMRGGFVDGQSDVIACAAPKEACQGLNDSRLAKFQSFKVVN